MPVSTIKSRAMAMLQIESNGLFVILTLCLLAISAVTVGAQVEPQSNRSTPKKVSAESLIQGTAVVVRVVDVTDHSTAEEELEQAAEGNKFISIQIVVDNTKGTQDWELTADSFRLKDDEGNVYETEGSGYGSSALMQPTLKSGIVDGGDLVKGWITFQIGETVSAKLLRLRYEVAGSFGEASVKSGWVSLSGLLK